MDCIDMESVMFKSIIILSTVFMAITSYSDTCSRRYQPPEEFYRDQITHSLRNKEFEDVNASEIEESIQSARKCIIKCNKKLNTEQEYSNDEKDLLAIKDQACFLKHKLKIILDIKRGKILNDKDGHFYRALKNAQRLYSGELGSLVKGALDKLSNWREQREGASKRKTSEDNDSTSPKRLKTKNPSQQTR